jgi:hypothetical protein
VLPPGLGGASEGPRPVRGSGRPGLPGEVTTCFNRLRVLPAGAGGPGGTASRGGARLLKMANSVGAGATGAGLRGRGAGSGGLTTGAGAGWGATPEDGAAVAT